MNPVQRRLAQVNEYREWAALAQQQTGKGLLTQLQEIMDLKGFGGQCGITDYYWHKLYDDGYLKGRGRQDFLGWRLLQEFSLALNPRYSVLPAWDKIAFVQLADAARLPIAPGMACFHRASSIAPALGLHLKSREAVGAFLRDPSIYPLFGKPAFSQGGYGTAYLAGLDTPADSLVMLDGKTMRVDDFLNRLEVTVDHRYHKPQCGFLFQKPLNLAPEIAAISHWSAICSVRVICLNGPEGVTPIRAAWKIAVQPNHTDNFGMGDHGNLLADVDLKTGQVRTTIGGFWPQTQVLLKHPVSGLVLEGFQLPGWQRVLEVCRLGGPVFPLMKIHHWDFALTDQGPVIMELNDLGGTQIAQMHGHGVLTLETREFLKRHANRQAHPWIKKL
jgi:Sugar-transfer associated ATP-grasp